MTTTYDLQKIRTLLTEGFTADELHRFCYDQSDFRPVYNQLATNTGKAEIIHQLLEYAEQKVLIEELLTWARKNNLARYEEYKPYFDGSGFDGPARDNSSPHSLLEEIELPGGAMKPQSRYYIEREADTECFSYLKLSQAVTLFIQSPRQMGKSSLVQKMIYRAKKDLKKKSVFINFQELPKQYLQNDEEKFLIELCCLMGDRLGVPEAINKYWHGSRTNISKCGRYLSEYLVPQVEAPFILAMDEVERTLTSSFRANFFGMLRSWHEARAYDENFKKISLLISSSTESYLLIDDVNQSPFNVAELISLRDFTEAEVSELNRRYQFPLSQEQICDLVNLLGGHPYLTQKAFSLLATKKFDMATLLAKATEDGGPFEDILCRYWLIILDNPTLKQVLTHICRYHTYEENRVFHRLKGAGLIKRAGQKVILRNNLYANYFEKRLK